MNTNKSEKAGATTLMFQIKSQGQIQHGPRGRDVHISENLSKAPVFIFSSDRRNRHRSRSADSCGKLLAASNSPIHKIEKKAYPCDQPK